MCLYGRQCNKKRKFVRRKNRYWIMELKRIAAFVLLCIMSLAWMGAIFGFSASDAYESTEQSHGVVELILKIFVSDFDEMPEEERQQLIQQYDKPVRKTAHFAAYALLGMLTYMCAGSISWIPFRYAAPSAISLPLCIAFALSDEYHQTFVDGRAGRMSDVIIDGLGALCGTALAAMVIIIYIKNRIDKGEIKRMQELPHGMEFVQKAQLESLKCMDSDAKSRFKKKAKKVLDKSETK